MIKDYVLEILNKTKELDAKFVELRRLV